MLLYILSRLGIICQGLASAEAWHAILYLAAPWQYLQRLGMLFCILSRLGSICLGLACYANIFSRLGNICQGLVFCSISYHARHALAVSAEAWQCWHVILISYHALAVSAQAWHSTLYLITPWQYLLRLGILLYILSRLGSICRGLACYSNISSRLGSICPGLAFYSLSYHGMNSYVTLYDL